MLRKLRLLFHRGQPGFSLIEMIIVVALTGLIGFGVASATAQVISQAPRNADFNAASSQVANAIHWISRDAQMAQTVITDDDTGFPLTLSWTEWDNSVYQVIYSLADNEITRSYSAEGGDPTVTLVAEHISEDRELTSCNYTNDILTINITAVMGEGIHRVQVSRLRDIAPRPGI
jgi:prepilin-type N-terminal cleavage/methylation domain-containing protein